MSRQACVRCGLFHPAGQLCPIAAGLPTLAAASVLAPGTLVGDRFRIESVAHRSNMSTVYKAIDTKRVNTPVALKELCAGNLPPDEQSEVVAWLAREAGLISSLNDARLPQLLSSFSEGNRHYVAMWFVEGETLEELVQRTGPCDEDDVARWGFELAELLTLLHGQEPPIIFRDLKPANVLLHHRHLMLLDFGVARPLVRGIAATAVGTPGYAAPEQYQGMADEQSDLYSLGATMHRLLSGLNPETKRGLQFSPLRMVRTDVSPGMARLVDMMLETPPQRRPRHAGEVAMWLGFRQGDHLAYPLYKMYWQMIVAAVIGFFVGVKVYGAVFGDAVTGDYAGNFKTAEPLADTFRVLLVFAPGLLAFAPLASGTLRDMARQHVFARRCRNRAIRLLLFCFSTPLATWLAALYIRQWDGQVAVPARQGPLGWLPFVAVLIAVAGLTRGLWQLSRLRSAPVRFSSYGVLGVCALAVTALVGTYFIAPPATPIVQADADAHIGIVRGLASDSAGNLYVLDDFGLRKRTTDGRFHLLLNLADPCSPHFIDGSRHYFTSVALLPDGRPILNDMGQHSMYVLSAPGSLTFPPFAGGGYFGNPSSMALAGADAVYLADASAGTLATFPMQSLTGFGYVQPAGASDATWRPDAVAVDRHDAILVLNGAPKIHGLQVLAGNDQMRTIATLPISFFEGSQYTLAVGADGTYFVSNSYTRLAVSPDARTVTTRAHDVGLLALSQGHAFFTDRFGHLYLSQDGFASRRRIGKPLSPSCPYTPASFQ